MRHAVGGRPRKRRASRETSPTPIYISERTRRMLLAAAGILAILLVWQAPTVLTLLLGGAALAIVLSFPVGRLSRYMPRGAAILLVFLAVAGILAATLTGLVPLLLQQLGSLINALPGIARNVGEKIGPLAGRLAGRGLLPAVPAEFMDSLQQDLLRVAQSFASRLLGQLGGFVTGAAGTIATVFGMVFIAIYMVSGARKIQATALRATPRRYRADVSELWDAFRFTLSRYLGGLALSLAIQGALSAIGLYFLGVPYAALLGGWVSLTALIPYLGVFLGAAPAVLVALSVSPTTALLTVGLYAAIQLLEGNVLTPRIQGQAVGAHPVVVFLAVVAGGQLAGLAGAVLAVPTLAVLRVLVDFFHARLRTADGERLRVPGRRREVTGAG